jgi:hypothetical protein
MFRQSHALMLDIATIVMLIKTIPIVKVLIVKVESKKLLKFEVKWFPLEFWVYKDGTKRRLDFHENRSLLIGFFPLLYMLADFRSSWILYYLFWKDIKSWGTWRDISLVTLRFHFSQTQLQLYIIKCRQYFL